MGIFIHMNISKSVTKEEWEKVYNETLFLVEKLPFAERDIVNIHGINTMCLIRTIERKETYGWDKEKTRIGWHTCGDYRTMRMAESQYVDKDLISEDRYDPNAKDPIYCLYKENTDELYWLFGNKTQGEPYHIYLLAVCCLIKDRLPGKAFVKGDITKGQCIKAVELANKFLDTPIDIPARCDLARMFDRISKFDLTDVEKLDLFKRFYLGPKDTEYGEFINAYFSQEALDEMWKDYLSGRPINTWAFDSAFEEYFVTSDNLEKLCSYIDFSKETNSSNDKNERDTEDNENANRDTDEGDDVYKKFVKRVMDAKFHLKEKDCEDILDINQNESTPYTIHTLLAQFAFLGARNKKVDRYIPIETIRDSLRKGIGDKCDVDAIIDDYLAEEAKQEEIKISKDMSEDDLEEAARQDPSETFKQIYDLKKEEIQEDMQYGCSSCEDLIYYSTEKTVHPDLDEFLVRVVEFFNELIEEEEFKTLMQQDAHVKCEWLIENNTSILVRDMDWEKVFTDIEENKDSFRRYYPLFRLKLSSMNLVHLVTAFLINDDLYAYAQTLFHGTDK